MHYEKHTKAKTFSSWRSVSSAGMVANLIVPNDNPLSCAGPAEVPLPPTALPHRAVHLCCFAQPSRQRVSGPSAQYRSHPKLGWASAFALSWAQEGWHRSEARVAPLLAGWAALVETNVQHQLPSELFDESASSACPPRQVCTAVPLHCWRLVAPRTHLLLARSLRLPVVGRPLESARPEQVRLRAAPPVE